MHPVPLLVQNQYKQRAAENLKAGRNAENRSPDSSGGSFLKKRRSGFGPDFGDEKSGYKNR